MLDNIPLTLGIEAEDQIIHPEMRTLHSYVQELLKQGMLIAATKEGESEEAALKRVADFLTEESVRGI